MNHQLLPLEQIDGRWYIDMDAYADSLAGDYTERDGFLFHNN